MDKFTKDSIEYLKKLKAEKKARNSQK